MFGPRIHLFTLFGFPIRIDLSWFIIAVLITWSLAEGWFANPEFYPSLADQAGLRWIMGVVGALGLFASIVLHELAHAKVAESFGLPMKGITLFIFGGVAEMSDEPPSAKAEFFVAIAGPIASVLIGTACLAGYYVTSLTGWPVAITGVLAYLAIINFVLVAFNLIPAFPLDGGRVLRSILWAIKDNLRWATNITSQIGAGFGLALMLLAVVQLLLGGSFIAAMWWFLIGLFLRNAAQMSFQQLLIRKALEGETVNRFMNDHPVTVTPDMPIDRVVDDYIYHYHHKLYPVVEQGKLLGCVTLNQIRDIPREQWNSTNVDSIKADCGPTNTIDAHRDAMEALTLMQKTGQSRLMVIEGNQLVGIVSLKDLMAFLSLKVELDDTRPSQAA